MEKQVNKGMLFINKKVDKDSGTTKTHLSGYFTLEDGTEIRLVANPAIDKTTGLPKADKYGRNFYYVFKKEQDGEVKTEESTPF